MPPCRFGFESEFEVAKAENLEFELVLALEVRPRAKAFECESASALAEDEDAPTLLWLCSRRCRSLWLKLSERYISSSSAGSELVDMSSGGSMWVSEDAVPASIPPPSDPERKRGGGAVEQWAEYDEEVEVWECAWECEWGSSERGWVCEWGWREEDVEASANGENAELALNEGEEKSCESRGRPALADETEDEDTDADEVGGCLDLLLLRWLLPPLPLLRLLLFPPLPLLLPLTPARFSAEAESGCGWSTWWVPSKHSNMSSSSTPTPVSRRSRSRRLREWACNGARDGECEEEWGEEDETEEEEDDDDDDADADADRLLVCVRLPECLRGARVFFLVVKDLQLLRLEALSGSERGEAESASVSEPVCGALVSPKE
jgi:hypothetical protein